MDEIWYEWRPFLFLAMGGFALFYGQGNRLLTISGIVLFIASGFTLKSRLDYRKRSSRLRNSVPKK